MLGVLGVRADAWGPAHREDRPRVVRQHPNRHAAYDVPEADGLVPGARGHRLGVPVKGRAVNGRQMSWDGGRGVLLFAGVIVGGGVHCGC